MFNQIILIMKKTVHQILLIMLLGSANLIAQDNIDYITAFKDTLTALSNRSENEFFQLHCQSIITVIDSKDSLSSQEETYIKNAYETFNNVSDTIANSKNISSYMNRMRPFIFTWESPMEGEAPVVVFHPPKNWDPSKKYPVYVQLHGTWDVAYNNINYMTWYLSQDPTTTFAFEDGYYLAPWGFRTGYDDESGVANIWEAINFISNYVDIDTTKRYICGHSYGGWGAMNIASYAPEKWAGVGIHASAFDFSVLEEDKLNLILDLPIYFVIGTGDTYADIAKEYCYDFLVEAGHRMIKFVTFEGGHEYRQQDVEQMYLWLKDPDSLNIEDPTDNITTTILSENITLYPNPFQSTVYINYILSSKQHIVFEIYNSYGQLIDILTVDDQPVGKNTINWTPNYIPNGVYFIRTEIDNKVVTKKLIYSK